MSHYSSDLRQEVSELLVPEDLVNQSRANQVKQFKRFLKIEKERLKKHHRELAKEGVGSVNPGVGLEISEAHADMMDVLIQNIYEVAADNSSKEFPVTLIATGGYGRGVLNPGSDIDILFLTDKTSKSLSKETKECIENILYILWDIGFEVGHATRSIRECISKAKEDSQICTSLIESRLIYGDEKKFNQCRDSFYRQCIKGKEKQYLQDRLIDREERHSKADHTPYLQEPHVKRGVGGLREYQNLCWMTYFKFNSTDLEVLLEEGAVTERGLSEIIEAYDFLLRVRNELHYVEHPPSDILTLRKQGQIAEHFRYPQKTKLRRIEAFMRDYYRHTSNLLHRSNSIFDRLELQSREHKAKPLIGWRKQGQGEPFDGFYIKDERLYAEHVEIFDEDPTRLMRVFLHSQLHGVRFSTELAALIECSYSHINRHFRYDEKVRESFETILSHKGNGAGTLRQMHRVGILGRYMPEFGALTCLVQHEFFHRYSADEHTLNVLDILDELSGDDLSKPQPYSTLYDNFDDPYSLYIAILLHDAGRAANVKTHADASTEMAAKVCKRLKIPAEQRQLILFLVDNHLLLWQTATGKNIDEEEVIEEFAGIVKNQRYLDALLIMTYADANGTSDQSYTSWKEDLILHLYRSTSFYLRGKEQFAKLVQNREDLKKEIQKSLSSSYGNEIDEHFEGMPSHYFPTRSAPRISRHLKLIRSFREKEKDNSEIQPAVYWKERLERGHTELTVVSTDKHALLARITGALAANRINIFSADLFRRDDGIVLDTFRVCDPTLNPRIAEVTRNNFEKLLLETLDLDVEELEERLLSEQQRQQLPLEKHGVDLPRRAYINNDVHHSQTVIQVQTQDRLGLLFDLFRAIGSCGLEITNARINTEKGAAIDNIYVKNSAGEKLSNPKLLEKLQAALDEAIA